MSSAKTAVKHRPVTELRGLRPAPLVVRKESHKIHKPPREPVVIYMVPPKVIHAEASEFMGLVQRLTGLSSSPCVDAIPSTSDGEKGNGQFPVRVKDRALDRSGLEGGNSFPTLFLHDPSRLSYRGDHDEGSSASSRSWFLRGDYMDQGPSRSSGYVLGSPGYLARPS